MSIMPGEGNKASDQQAIVTTEFSCSKDTDCPTCVGGLDFLAANETKPTDEFTFIEELAYGKCENSKCQLSDSCLIWDCGTVEDCNSIKKTVLDNTVEKINKRPGLLIFAIIVGVAFFML